MWICSSKTWNIGGMSLPPSPKTLRLEEFGLGVVGGLLLKEVVAHRGRTEAFF